METFYAVYASRVPNCECPKCGYFQLSQDEIKFNEFGTKWLYCNECGRTVVRYYIPIGCHDPLDKVPDGYIKEVTNTDNDNADELLALLRKDLTNN